jgi:HlyD family secretion protein
MRWSLDLPRGAAYLRTHWQAALVLLLVPSVLLAALATVGEREPLYLTAPVTRGTMTSLVTATGTVRPVGEVRVGSELSGRIAELLVDFDDSVHEGQPLARLDPQVFRAIVREAEAALEIAEANLLMQEAALARAEAELATAHATRAVGSAETAGVRAQREEAERELARIRALAQEAIISGSELDRAQARAATATALLRAAETQELAGDATTRGAEAALKMGLAGLQNAAAEVKRSRAVLERATVDLERSIIRSPIDGVVIGRNVDSGQTVTVGLEAPTLFTLAQDLRRMEVHAQVDQADIGRVAVGQTAYFAVDAHPEHVFSGNVMQIRKSPQIVQNIVTYTVIISADNPQLLLLPGMTAILRITIVETENTLMLPAAALRFRPPQQIAANGEALAASGALAMPDQGTPMLVWVLARGELDPRVLGIGSSDGSVAAVLGGPLETGDLAVVGLAEPSRPNLGLRFGL